MKFYKESDLPNFEFWGGAVANAELLTNRELNELETIIEAEYVDGISETEVNDLMWFDFKTICGWIGVNFDEDTGEIER